MQTIEIIKQTDTYTHTRTSIQQSFYKELKARNQCGNAKIVFIRDTKIKQNNNKKKKRKTKTKTKTTTAELKEQNEIKVRQLTNSKHCIKHYKEGDIKEKTECSC